MGPRADGRTIVPHTVEEAYEVADAALAGDAAKLRRRARRPALPGRTSSRCCSRSGAQATSRRSRAESTTKLVRRHPHVFGDGRGGDRRAASASAGRRSRPSRRGAQGIFHDVPASLPALLHARKVAAARGRRRLRLARPRGAAREAATRSSASCAQRSRGRRPAPETEPDRRVAAELGDVLFTRRERRAASERRSGARAPSGERSGSSSGSSSPSASPRRPADVDELDLDAQER